MPDVFVDAFDKRGGDPGIATKVQLRFTVGRREDPVTAEGEMLFEAGRQYWGIWYLYWGD